MDQSAPPSTLSLAPPPQIATARTPRAWQPASSTTRLSPRSSARATPRRRRPLRPPPRRRTPPHPPASNSESLRAQSPWCWLGQHCFEEGMGFLSVGGGSDVTLLSTVTHQRDQRAGDIRASMNTFVYNHLPCYGYPFIDASCLCPSNRVGTSIRWMGKLGLPPTTDQNRVDARTPGSIERPRHPSYLMAMTARHLHSALDGDHDHGSSGARGTRPLVWHQPKWTATRDDDQEQALRNTWSHSQRHLDDVGVDTQDTIGLHQPTKVPSSSPSTITHLLERGSSMPENKASAPPPSRRPFLVDTVCGSMRLFSYDDSERDKLWGKSFHHNHGKGQQNRYWASKG